MNKSINNVLKIDKHFNPQIAFNKVLIMNKSINNILKIDKHFNPQIVKEIGKATPCHAGRSNLCILANTNKYKY